MTIRVDAIDQTRGCPVPAAAADAICAEPDAQPNDKANILIVDDTTENLTAFESVLADLGQNVVKAASGREALHALLRRDFAVILLDVNMPEMDGFETARLIRQRDSSAHTPIIFVSAVNTSDRLAYHGYSLGAVDYIFTPVVPDVLRSKVAVFVELYLKTQQVKRQAAQLHRRDQLEHQRRLAESAERLDLQTRRNRFFSLSLELLGILDFEGRLLQVNPSWETVLGFTSAEVLRRPGYELIHVEDRPAVREQLRQLQERDSRACFEARYTCHRGGFRWLSFAAASVVGDRMIYLVGRDITAQKLAEQQIQRLNVALTNRAAELELANDDLHREMAVRSKAEAALKDSNAELEAFAYTVSHDLRAPLRAMQGFAQALLEDCTKELCSTGENYARRIISAARRLDALIQDLLLYSRISHTNLQLEKVDLGRVVAEALAQLEMSSQQANACIVRHEPFRPVIAHHATLVQVIGNLLCNGLKFVAPGTTPKIHIRVESRQNRARLCVEDNGIGIAPEFHGRIFRVFERLHGMDAYPGTGVGLAIVRKGVERMGGAVGVESNLGRGSRFWIELPLATALNESRDGNYEAPNVVP